jgi:N-dimethylarginine dimethylaminohydrolase
MVAPLRRVLVKRPDEAFGAADPERWHYTARPLLDAARREHDAFVEILREDGCEIIYHESAPPDCADAIFTHDPAIVTDAGAIMLGMGKPARGDEPAALARMFSKLGVPILDSLRGEARAEGGSDDPLACLHLMSCISLVDDDLAVVFLPLLPGQFVRLLERRGCHLVEVPDKELATMGPNVLAVGPRNCVMLQGNPITQRRLRTAGCRVRTYVGDEISLKAEGGATCLTRPILREV